MLREPFMRMRDCFVCPYYLRRSSYCALFAVKVHDPLRPPCRAESARQPEGETPPEATRPRSHAGPRATPPAVSERPPARRGSAARAAALILFIFLILTNAVWYLEYTKLSAEHRSLVNRYQDLSFDYNTLLSNYNYLLKRYDELKEDFDELYKMYTFLNVEHLNLQLKYNNLQLDYEYLKDGCAKTSSSFLSLLNVLESLAYIPEAFKRVLSWSAVEAVGKYVNESGVSPGDLWGSLQKIYDYIRAKVRYTYDVEIPVPSPPLLPNADSELLLGGWSYTMYRNYVQTPEFTAKYGQGDCDDQAILAYAMIKYYMIKVHGREYALYIAVVHFDNSSHLAVFLPVKGGELTIIDPAGSYLTVDARGRICSRPAGVELQNYRNWWSRGKYQLKRIDLYSVDVRTGSYEKVASGTLEEIAAFLSKS